MTKQKSRVYEQIRVRESHLPLSLYNTWVVPKVRRQSPPYIFQ